MTSKRRIWLVVGMLLTSLMLLTSSASAWWWTMTPPGQGPIDCNVDAEYWGGPAFIKSDIVWHTGGPAHAPEPIPVAFGELVFEVDYVLTAKQLGARPVKVDIQIDLYYEPNVGQNQHVIRVTDSAVTAGRGQLIQKIGFAQLWDVQSKLPRFLMHADEFYIQVYLFANIWNPITQQWDTKDVDSDLRFYYINGIQPFP